MWLRLWALACSHAQRQRRCLFLSWDIKVIVGVAQHEGVGCGRGFRACVCTSAACNIGDVHEGS